MIITGTVAPLDIMQFHIANSDLGRLSFLANDLTGERKGQQREEQ
jgi:hypothetical protein